VSNLCVAGNCHTDANCPTGQICGVSVANSCGGCTPDTDCTNDLATYGPGYICFQGSCKLGDCHTSSSDCSGANLGRICGASSPNNCGSCTTDAQCKADPFYTNTSICNTAAGPNAGKCVSGGCSTTSTTCSANSADFCCGTNPNQACVTGNCLNNTDCVEQPQLRRGLRLHRQRLHPLRRHLRQHYYVDPVKTATTRAPPAASLAGGTPGAVVQLQDHHRAMQVIGSFRAPNTHVVILGPVSGLAAADALRSRCSRTSSYDAGRAITITLAAAAVQAAPASDSGFILANSGSGIQGSAAAPLTLDGNGNTSGRAITVQPGAGNSVTISNLTVQNTRDHGIYVTNGVLNIGAPGRVT
jgi:hypothetical protein